MITKESKIRKKRMEAICAIKKNPLTTGVLSFEKRAALA